MGGEAHMKAGVELDRRIAEIYLPHGEWYVTSPRSDSVICWKDRTWMPSTDIADAWKLLPLMPVRMDDFTLQMHLHNFWTAGYLTATGWAYDAEADTAAHAICLCAIKIKEAHDGR